MNEKQMGLFDGERRKAAGVNLVTENNERWVDMAAREIELIVRRNGKVTADDIRHLPPPNHPNAIGAAFSAVAKRGIMKISGITKSTHPSTHARRIIVWELI